MSGSVVLYNISYKNISTFERHTWDQNHRDFTSPLAYSTKQLPVHTWWAFGTTSMSSTERTSRLWRVLVVVFYYYMRCSADWTCTLGTCEFAICASLCPPHSLGIRAIEATPRSSLGASSRASPRPSSARPPSRSVMHHARPSCWYRISQVEELAPSRPTHLHRISLPAASMFTDTSRLSQFCIKW